MINPNNSYVVVTVSMTLLGLFLFILFLAVDKYRPVHEEGAPGAAPLELAIDDLAEEEEDDDDCHDAQVDPLIIPTSRSL